MNCVWLLYQQTGGGEPWLLGVFSSAESGARWLRKSSRFMREPVGPIVPTPEGARVRLTARFFLDPHPLDPPPVDAFDDGVLASKNGAQICNHQVAEGVQ